MSQPKPSLCSVCKTPSKMRCSRCKSVFYCGKEHAVADWPTHKGTCRAAPLQLDAVLFPASGEQPHMVKVDVIEKPPDPRTAIVGMGHTPDLSPWLGNATPAVSHIEKDTKGRKLPHALAIYFNDNFKNDGSPLNLCIQRMTNGKCYGWCGDVIAFRTRPLPKDNLGLSSSTLEDVSAWQDYFAGGGNGFSAVELRYWPKPKK